MPRTTTALALPCMLLISLCACGDERELQRCQEAASRDCWCADGREGSQTCDAEGRFGVCQCETAEPCQPGQTLDCMCIDGSSGMQTCQASAAFGPCECALGDASMPDAGGDGDASDCTSTADADGDGLPDCDEVFDGNPWTAKDAFNGLRAKLMPACAGSADQCNALADGPAVPEECAAAGVLASGDVHGGWDFGPDASGDACDDSYGLSPELATCPATFSVQWDGFVQLAEGRHCFFMSTPLADNCGAVYLSLEPADRFRGWDALPPISRLTLPGVQSDDTGVGGVQRCVTLAAGVYPLRLFYDSWGPEHRYRVRYCRADSGVCYPGGALPSGLLRPTYP